MGSRWKAEDVYWRSAPKNGKLLGIPATAKRSPEANFAEQSGISVLYSDSTPIYVGQSTTEKITPMERLWADLSQRFQELPSPDWHGDVLAERIAAVRQRRTAFVDWNDATQRLRDRLGRENCRPVILVGE